MQLAHWFLILCALALIRPRVLGQEQVKPIVVSPLIGDTLDVNERDNYRLFPDLDGFEWAVFYLNPDSSLRVKVSLLEKGVRRDTTIARYRTLRAVRNQIRQLAEGNPATRIYRDLQRDLQEQNKLRQLAERAPKPEGPVAKVYAQEVKDKVVILSPRVGSAIDAAERERYELFPEVRDFDRAVFLQTPAKTYYAKIMFVGPHGERRNTTVQYSENALLVLAEEIEHFEDLKEKKYHMGDQPAKIRVVESEIKPEEAVAQRTQGTDVVVLLKSGQEIEGKLVSVRDSSVLIAVEDEETSPGLSTGIKGILAIKDTVISGVTIERGSHVFLGMGVGYLGGALIGGVIESIGEPGDQVAAGLAAGIGGFVGALAGGIVGAFLHSDIEVNLSVPAERSALKKLARFPDKEPKSFQVIK